MNDDITANYLLWLVCSWSVFYRPMWCLVCKIEAKVMIFLRNLLVSQQLVLLKLADPFQRPISVKIPVFRSFDVFLVRFEYFGSGLQITTINLEEESLKDVPIKKIILMYCPTTLQSFVILAQCVQLISARKS